MTTTPDWTETPAQLLARARRIHARIDQFGRDDRGIDDHEGYAAFWTIAPKILDALEAALEAERDAAPSVVAPAAGPLGHGDRVTIPDYYGDGRLDVLYRPNVPYAPLTLSTHGHWSIDMTVEQLLAAINDAGGPDVRVLSEEATR